VPHGSGSCLPVGRALGYHASCGPLWAVGLKHEEKLSRLPVRQGSPVPNAHAHISKEPDIGAIISLQDVWVGTVASACKMCRQVATV
jgi:hypothetical protein